jgi:hypothetical protein
MTPVHGKDVIAFIGDVPIFCGKDCVFTEEKEVIEASTVTSGEFKEFRLRKRSWQMDVTGLTKIDNSDGQVSYFDLISSSAAMELQSVSIGYTDANGNAIMISGSAHILNSGIGSPKNEFAGSSVIFIGNGNYDVV